MEIFLLVHQHRAPVLFSQNYVPLLVFYSQETATFTIHIERISVILLSE